MIQVDLVILENKQTRDRFLFLQSTGPVTPIKPLLLAGMMNVNHGYFAFLQFKAMVLHFVLIP